MIRDGTAAARAAGQRWSRSLEMVGHLATQLDVWRAAIEAAGVGSDVATGARLRCFEAVGAAGRPKLDGGFSEATWELFARDNPDEARAVEALEAAATEAMEAARGGGGPDDPAWGRLFAAADALEAVRLGGRPRADGAPLASFGRVEVYPENFVRVDGKPVTIEDDVAHAFVLELARAATYGVSVPWLRENRGDVFAHVERLDRLHRNLPPLVKQQVVSRDKRYYLKRD